MCVTIPTLMIPLSKIAIIGRPNVGKSTLINTLLNRQQTVTYDEPGVTRDILEFPLTHEDKHVMLIDTGGLLEGEGKDMSFQSDIESRVKAVLKDVQKIIFMVDYKTGLHPLDKSIAKWLYKNGLQCLVAINKVDDPSRESYTDEFRKLGFKESLPISSLNKRGIKDLLKWIFEGVTGYGVDIKHYKDAYKVAFVGRPNVGKSSLFNAIINQDRALVSDIAGTTRDTIDTLFKTQGQYFRFIDTAGIKRRRKMADSVEFFSINRTERTIHQAHLVVVILDVTRGLSTQDKKIISTVLTANKNMIIFVNKWDTMEIKTDQIRRDYESMILSAVPQLAYFPFIFGSAKEHHHLGKLFTTIKTVIEQGEYRISTSELNKFVDHAIKPYSVPAKYKKRVKIYYATQTGVSPMTIVFSVNAPEFIKNEYIRYLEKRIRQAFGELTGNPIQIIFKKH
jgi:GTP-binding protein